MSFYVKKAIRNKEFMIMLAAAVILILIPIFAPVLAPHDPIENDYANAMIPGNKEYPFGTDQIGRCILSRLLLADEPTSALDVTVQAQVIYEMMELRKKYGTTIIFVTHSMGVAAYMSDIIGVMQNGRLVEWGKTEDVISSPREEYTKSLLGSIIELRDERLITTI